MIRLFFILFVATGLLTACDNSKDIEDLRKQLEEATSPEARAKAIKELIAEQKRLIEEEVKKRGELYSQLEKTKNKEECDKLLKQYQDSGKKIKTLVTEYAIGELWDLPNLGDTCTEAGYRNLYSEGSEVAE